MTSAVHDRSEPPGVFPDPAAAQLRQTAAAVSMKAKPTEKALTADDLECLWAIARRTTLQDRLVESRGRQLQKRGLIELTHQWPTLTPKGKRILKESSAQAILDLHRESHSGK